MQERNRIVTSGADHDYLHCIDDRCLNNRRVEKYASKGADMGGD